MPCTSMSASQLEALRLQRALDALKKRLRDRSVRVQADARGNVTFDGWAERGEWCDGCAYRTLLAEGNAELRRAMVAAGTNGPVARRLGQ